MPVFLSSHNRITFGVDIAPIILFYSGGPDHRALFRRRGAHRRLCRPEPGVGEDAVRGGRRCLPDGQGAQDAEAGDGADGGV